MYTQPSPARGALPTIISITSPLIPFLLPLALPSETYAQDSNSSEARSLQVAVAPSIAPLLPPSMITDISSQRAAQPAGHDAEYQSEQKSSGSQHGGITPHDDAAFTAQRLLAYIVQHPESLPNRNSTSLPLTSIPETIPPRTPLIEYGQSQAAAERHEWNGHSISRAVTDLGSRLPSEVRRALYDGTVSAQDREDICYVDEDRIKRALERSLGALFEDVGQKPAEQYLRRAGLLPLKEKRRGTRAIVETNSLSIRPNGLEATAGASTPDATYTARAGIIPKVSTNGVGAKAGMEAELLLHNGSPFDGRVTLRLDSTWVHGRDGDNTSRTNASATYRPAAIPGLDISVQRNTNGDTIAGVGFGADF